MALRFGGRLPHELRIPLTYYQTLLNFLIEESKALARARNDEGDETDVVSVDVDALIRKGQTTGFGVSK